MLGCEGIPLGSRFRVLGMAFYTSYLPIKTLPSAKTGLSRFSRGDGELQGSKWEPYWGACLTTPPIAFNF